MMKVGCVVTNGRGALVVLFCVMVPASAIAQTRHEIIRGRVTTDSARVIAAADVIVTMAPNRETFRATSDSGGRYQIDVANGTGDYLVYVASPGRRSFRKRVTRSGSDSVFVVDAVLPREVATMAAVRTVARRTPPPRADDAASTAGALSAQVGGVNGALSPDQIGDLAAMAATVPGIALTPDGAVSAFGLDASQNRATVNGTAFDGASIPRDLPMRTRIYTSSYDPAIGGFGGALIAVDVSPGQVFTFSRAHLALDAPQLQAADRTAQRLGQRYQRYQGSYGRSGELFPDTWVYSAALQAARRSADSPSLSTLDVPGLQRLGVASDSVTRFLQLLGAAGIPTQGTASADQTTSSIGTGFRIDRARATTFGGLERDSKPRIGFVGFANYTRSSHNSASPLAPASHGSHSTGGSFSLQANYSRYFGSDAAYLDEARSAFSYNLQRSSPYLNLPGGFVLVGSSLPDGTQSIAGLHFGGGGIGNDNRSWRWETTNELSFNLAKAVAHRIKVFTQAQVDGYAMTTAPLPGTFSYNSLADLAANAPASFARTLFSPARRGGEVSAALAIGDYWVKSPELQLVFGPRIEWSGFTTVPRRNADVERLFGGRSDAAPSALHVSPRFGFTWLYRGTRIAGRPSGGFAMSSNLGSIYTPPKGVLRGGIGEFRSPLPPTLLSSAIAESGVPGTTVRRVSCVGSAVPVANWALYSADPASAPTACIGSTSFADSAASVQLFDAAYDAPRRWTGSLTWGSAYRFLFYTLDASYSLNVDQPGIVDLNFAGAPHFSLVNEANRPVFVSASAIVPFTGLVSPVGARQSAAFGRVVSHRSDLRSTVRQVTLSLQPYIPERIGKWMVGGSYTYTDSRSLTRGFDGATLGDPREREWSAGFAPRHQIRANLGYTLPFWGLTITSYWGFQSGYPYTPMVQGDINGDGLSNDRAFVFNPASAPSDEVGNALATLLTTAPSEARRCLTRQLGEVAARNSCRRPWALMMNARADWRHRFGDPWHYATVSLNFSNPLGGIDQLLHGSNGLRGWGLPAAPDPTLYFVRGFDPAAQRFQYQVNPRFGNTRPSVSAFYNPFRVSIDVSFSLTRNIQKQQVEYYLRPVRSVPGKRPPADTILARVNSSGASPVSPYGWILANVDSLLLSPAQVNALTAGQEHYRFRIDSTWRALAVDLAGLPNDFDPEAAIKRINEANRVFQPASAAQEGAIIRVILTPIQLGLLPPQIARMIAPSPRSDFFKGSESLKTKSNREGRSR